MADDALPIPEARKKASKKRIGELLKRQRGLCASCPAVLAKINNGMVFICAPFDVDHVHPLNLLGSQDDDNLQCLCVPCHKAKTKTDIKRIAKGRRVRTDEERHASRMKAKATLTREVFKRERRAEAKIVSRNTFDRPSLPFKLARSESPSKWGRAGAPKRSWPKGRGFSRSARVKPAQ